VTIAATLAAEVTFTRPERANTTTAAGAGANVAFACRQPGRKRVHRQPFAPAGAAPPLAGQTALPEVRHRLPRRRFNTVDAIGALARPMTFRGPDGLVSGMSLDDSSARTLSVDAGGLDADAVTLDLLARLQLTARRCGFELRLRGSSPELRELIAFAGLSATLPEERRAGLRLEPGRQPEQRE
jgi:hypothetical protein